MGGSQDATIEGYASAPDPNADTDNPAKTLFTGYTTTVNLGEEKSEQTLEVPATAAAGGRKK